MARNNISGASALSQGRVRIFFTNALSSALYAAVCSAHRNDGNDGFVTTSNKTSTSFDVEIVNYSAGLYDFSFQCLVF